MEEQARGDHDAVHAETQVVSFSDEEPEVAGMEVVGMEVAEGMEVTGGMEAEAMAPDAREGLVAQAEGHMTQVQGWEEEEEWEEEEAELALHEPAAAAAGAVAPHVAEAVGPHAAGRDEETQLDPEAAESAETRADDEVNGAEEGRGGAEAARRRAAGLKEAVGDVHAEGDAPASRSFFEEDEEESPNATLDHPPRPGHLQAVEVQSDSMPDATVDAPPPLLQPGGAAAVAWRETAEQMVDMGFERTEVERALEACGGDFDSALEQLTQPAVPSPRADRRDATRVPQDARHDGAAGSQASQLQASQSQPSQLQPSQSQNSQLPRKRGASNKGRTGKQGSQKTSAGPVYGECPGCGGQVALRNMDYHLEHQCKSRLQPQPQLSQQREQQERQERQEREQQQQQQQQQQREQEKQERGRHEREQEIREQEMREKERREKERQESDRQDPSPAFQIRHTNRYNRGAASPAVGEARAAETPSGMLAGALADAGGNRVEGTDPDAGLFSVGEEEAMEQEDETVEEDAAAMEQGEEQVVEEEAAAADEETEEEREEEAEEADVLRHEPQSGSSDRGKCLVPETQPERCGLAARTRQACCIGLPPHASLRATPCALCPVHTI